MMMVAAYSSAESYKRIALLAAMCGNSGKKIISYRVSKLEH